MNNAVGFWGSNAGRNRASACSAQYCGVPSAVTRRPTRSGATNIRLVSSKRPASIRSTQIVKASPKAARVSPGRTDKVGDDSAAGLDHAVAHPSHAAGMLDAVRVSEAEIAREIRALSVGIGDPDLVLRLRRLR